MRAADGRKHSPNDVFLAVMGVTGLGKSYFISLCRGEPVEVKRLEACKFNTLAPAWAQEF